MSVDRTFGPLMMFGAGGTAVEVLRDTAHALPPARSQPRARPDAADAGMAPAAGLPRSPCRRCRVASPRFWSGSAISWRVIRRSARSTSIRCSPTTRSVIALDARVKVADAERRPARADGDQALSVGMADRCRTRWSGTGAHSPYPSGGRGALRRVLRQRHAGGSAPEVLHRRARISRTASWHGLRRSITHARWRSSRSPRTAARSSGWCAWSPTPTIPVAEYAILVRSDLKGRGLGWRLMQHLIAYAKAEKARAAARVSVGGKHDDAPDVPRDWVLHRMRARRQQRCGASCCGSIEVGRLGAGTRSYRADRAMATWLSRPPIGLAILSWRFGGPRMTNATRSKRASRSARKCWKRRCNRPQAPSSSSTTRASCARSIPRPRRCSASRKESSSVKT